MVYLSTAHGRWEATGADTAIVTFVQTRAGAEGQPLGTVTVRLGIALGAGGDMVGGEFAATIADPAGNVTANLAGR